jgi:hypothetical protein
LGKAYFFVTFKMTWGLFFILRKRSNGRLPFSTPRYMPLSSIYNIITIIFYTKQLFIWCVGFYTLTVRKYEWKKVRYLLITACVPSRLDHSYTSPRGLIPKKSNVMKLKTKSQASEPQSGSNIYSRFLSNHIWS